MQGVDFIFALAVFLMSVVIHEVFHGYTAYLLGDPTAKYAGRLTLNPLPHLDLFGSIFMPFLLVIFNSPIIFGWAKPVPYNPYNLKNQRWGPALVGASGPTANLLLALFFGFLLRFGYDSFLPLSFVIIASLIVQINLLLMIFNLVPIPPLDGSKVLFAFLPFHTQRYQYVMERFGFFFVLLFIFFFFPYVAKLISVLFGLITGITI
jgi:Zn-dependent protease